MNYRGVYTRRRPLGYWEFDTVTLSLNEGPGRRVVHQVGTVSTFGLSVCREKIDTYLRNFCRVSVSGKIILNETPFRVEEALALAGPFEFAPHPVAIVPIGESNV
jgi:hypothetical protein